MSNAPAAEPTPPAEQPVAAPRDATSERATSAADASPPRTVRNIVIGALVLALFVGLAIAATWPSWVDPEHIFIGPGGDNQLTLSFFALTQHAIATHSDPFFSTFLNAPDGVNLAWETTSPLVAVLIWPIDAVWGPVAGYDVALTAALALNGFVCTLVLRRILGGWVGAIIGGLLYAWSPFVNAHARGHLELTVLVTPPLLLWVIDRMVRTHRGSWRKNGLILAAIVVAQFYISTEVLLIEAMSVATLLVVLAVTHWQQTRELFRPIVQSGALALVISGLAVAWPVHVLTSYPQRPVGAIQGYDIYVADPLNFIVPNPNEAISPFTATSLHFSGNGAEATAYIGIPLLLLLIGVIIWQRRNRVMWVAVASAALLGLIALGGHLHIDGRLYNHIPLPWDLVQHLPIFQDVLTVRIFLVIYLILAFIVALAIERLRTHRLVARGLVGALVVLTFVSWFPEFPWVADGPPVPAFFTGDASRIPAGATVLVAPLPYTYQANAELWQAWAGVRFKIPGGYIHGPEYLAPRTMPSLGAVMFDIEQGIPAPPTQLSAMQADIERTGITTVINGPGPQMQQMHDLLVQVCGTDPVQDQGVEVWWTCGA